MLSAVQGKPCRNGHDGLRYIKSGICVHCARASTRRQNSPADKERNKAAKKRYLSKPEKLAATKAYQASWRRSENGKRGARASHLKAKRGLTTEQFDAMVSAQENSCAICGKPGEVEHHGLLSIDHDHSTGVVRGLLCDSCNVGLGRFGDDLDRLEKAAAYLRLHRGG